MKRLIYILLILLCAMRIIISVNILRINRAFAIDIEQKQADNKKLLSRIDFGNTYILGQTIKSGAVYLLQRKKSEIKSMLHYREDFRKEILEDFSIQDMKIKKDKE